MTVPRFTFLCVATCKGVRVCVCERERDNEGVNLATHQLALLGSIGGGSSRLLLGRKLISSILFDLKTRGTRLDDKKETSRQLTDHRKQFDRLHVCMYVCVCERQ
jgi:hypothetical protein